ncbi:hypothetical protein HYW46_06405 [Candidatus Daviesbacteria bacterium]|nr:hypothetical protein [Candidatus Daviesbacteria bacterium]
MKELFGQAQHLFYKVSIYYSIIAFLLVLVGFGVKDFGLAKIFWQVLPPLFATILFGLLFDYLETKKWQVSLGPVVSGLIIGLVGQFGERAWVLFLIGFVAMGIKFLVKLYGRNVFNPAASGLFLGLILFSSHPAWWGGERYPWIFYLWIPGLLFKLKRWAPMVGFLAPSALFGGLNILTSGSMLFFSSVMLIEPMTSPVKMKSGLIYGMVVAFGYLVFSKFILLDPLIISLLFGNILGRVLNRRLKT